MEAGAVIFVGKASELHFCHSDSRMSSTEPTTGGQISLTLGVINGKSMLSIEN